MGEGGREGNWERKKGERYRRIQKERVGERVNKVISEREEEEEQ